MKVAVNCAPGDVTGAFQILLQQPQGIGINLGVELELIVLERRSLFFQAVLDGELQAPLMVHDEPAHDVHFVRGCKARDRAAAIIDLDLVALAFGVLKVQIILLHPADSMFFQNDNVPLIQRKPQGLRSLRIKVDGIGQGPRVLAGPVHPEGRCTVLQADDQVVEQKAAEEVPVSQPIDPVVAVDAAHALFQDRIQGSRDVLAGILHEVFGQWNDPVQVAGLVGVLVNDRSGVAQLGIVPDLRGVGQAVLEIQPVVGAFQAHPVARSILTIWGRHGLWESNACTLRTRLLL